MKRILAEIQDGTFAKAWIAEHEAGRPNFNATRIKEQDQPLEAGRREAALDDAIPGST